ncbi:MAG: hypothetical protein H6741_08210 [Alphaproteobacteria bacterium]|nr:hypothetical protein [Alphaproteobacteria bacterium]
MTPDPRVRTLSRHIYPQWDAAWIKVADLQASLDALEVAPWTEERRGIRKSWLVKQLTNPIELLASIVDDELCAQLPEDSLWDELMGEPEQPRWRPFRGDPRARFDEIVAWSAFSDGSHTWDGDSARIWGRRPANAEERAWYAEARRLFFELLPPSESRFFEILPLPDEPEPWDPPMALAGLGPRFFGAVFLHGHLSEADWQAGPLG